jgi:hypothetical protein
MIESFLFNVDQYRTNDFDPKRSSTCDSGTRAEMFVAMEAAKNGFSVFFPIGHSQKADLIIWKPPMRPLTVQVKKATIQEGGSYKFMIGSGKPSCAANPNDYGKRYTKYQEDDFDILCAVIIERNSVLIYDLKSIVGKSSIRWSPHRGIKENDWNVNSLRL